MRYLRKNILAAMQSSAYRPMTVKELFEEFGVPRHRREEFRAVVQELADAGEIVLVKGNRFGLPRKMNLVVGRLSVHPDGFGFVAPEAGGGDVFVKAADLDTAMHGDKVVARLERLGRGERPEGKVIRVLERANTRVVGRFERLPGRGYLKPYDPHLPSDIQIPPALSMGASTGDMAVAEILDYAVRGRTPEGKIVEVLGPAEDPGVDEAVVIRQFSLPHAFGPETRSEARAVPRNVEAAEARKRLDLRGLFTVTIDGESARDFDDAVSVESSARGGWRLWVHIADVSHYVRPGSALDREALARGNSVYFPGMVLPMLPEELSNGICSLNPGVDRLAFTVDMEIDRLGRVTTSDFQETVIRSDARMTYTQVRDILAGSSPPPRGLPPEAGSRFGMMGEAAAKLREARMRRGSIDFDLPEAEIVLDLRGRIQDVFRAERNVAHRIIEEFMLAANRAVAMQAARLDLPFVYRVHEEPEAEKMDLFRRFAANFGHYLPEGKVQPLWLSKLVLELEGKREAPMINNLLLRSMKQARYSAENSGHFGLAFDHYTHFTSPIRRYPDLEVHRLMKMMVRQGGYGEKLEAQLAASLPATAEHCSERERKAMEAEREIVQLKKIRFIMEKVGEEYDGFITGVTTFGFFVELCDCMVEGLVHVSSLGDDYYVFDEETQALTGSHTRRSFRVGDEARVRVESVSLERKQIDFALLSAGAVAPGRPGRPAKAGRKRAAKAARRRPGKGRQPGGRGTRHGRKG